MILTPKSKVLEQPNRQTSLSHEHRRSPNPKTLITKPPNPVRKSPQTKNPENPKLSNRRASRPLGFQALFLRLARLLDRRSENELKEE